MSGVTVACTAFNGRRITGVTVSSACPEAPYRYAVSVHLADGTERSVGVLRPATIRDLWTVLKLPASAEPFLHAADVAPDVDAVHELLERASLREYAEDFLARAHQRTLDWCNCCRLWGGVRDVASLRRIEEGECTACTRRLRENHCPVCCQFPDE